MPKPGDFLLGLFEFFSILVPGAVVVLAASLVFPGVPAGPGLAGGGWAVFLLLSYLAGHALQLPAGIIDDRIYDDVYKPWFLKKEGRPPAGDRKAVLFWFFDVMQRLARAGSPGTPRFELLLRGAAKLLPEGRSAESVYDWAYTKVRLDSDPAITEVDRLQADSKLFRSIATALPLLAVACLCLAIVGASARMLLASVVLMGLVSPALWRYCHLRGKATMVLYRYFILLVETDGKKTRGTRSRAAPARRGKGT